MTTLQSNKDTAPRRAEKALPREVFLMIVVDMVWALTGRGQIAKALQIDVNTRYHRAVREAVCKRLAGLKLTEERKRKIVDQEQRERRVAETQEMFRRCLLGTTPKHIIAATEYGSILFQFMEPRTFYSMLSRPPEGVRRRRDLKDMLDDYHSYNFRHPPFTTTDISLYTQICASCTPLSTQFLTYLLNRDFCQLYQHRLHARLVPAYRSAVIMACIEGMTFHSSLRGFKIQPTPEGSCHIADIVDCLCTNEHVKSAAITTIIKQSLADGRLALYEYCMRTHADKTKTESR